MCTVVNFKDYGSKAALDKAFGNNWVYIGRANPYAGFKQSALANPFKAKDYGGQRGATLTDYKAWLWQKMQARDKAVLKALLDIKESTILVCWCKPEACHGDVVKAASKWLHQATTYWI